MQINKLLIGLVFVGFILSVILKFQNISLKDELDSKGTELIKTKTQNHILSLDLEIANQKMAFSNAQIKKISLDNEKLKALQPQIQERVITKFQKVKVPIKDDKCEIKLRYYESLLKELSDER